MANQKQKFDYLDEHLPYMLGQARYDFNKLHQTLPFRDWNASFQSFAVNARNLVEFLTNGDRGNFKANDFVGDFKNRKGDIQGAMKKLGEQVFHLGKSRPRENEAKFRLEAARAVMSWIEEGMKQFVNGLSADDKKIWNPKKADPALDEIGSASGGPTGPLSPPSASSSISDLTLHTSSVAPSLGVVLDPLRSNSKRGPA